MSSWTPTTYKTRNWTEYNQFLKQRGSLSIWFASEADDGFCGKLVETRWVGLVRAGLQHSVPTTKNVVRRHPVQGISRAAAPSE